MTKRRTSRADLRAVPLLLLPVLLPVLPMLPLLLILPIMLATGGCEGKQGDVRLIQVTHLAEIRMPGQTIPARNDTMLLWLGQGKARSETATSSFILREDLGLLYAIDHTQRSYAAVPLEDLVYLSRMVAGDEETPPEVAREMALLRNFQGGVATVRSTGEQAMIDGYHCQRYHVDITMGRSEMHLDQWVTRDIDLDLALLNRITGTALLLVPGSQSVLDALAEIDGVPVLTDSEITMLGSKTRSSTRLIEVTHETAPPGTFTVPEGYTPQRGANTGNDAEENAPDSAR